MKDSTFLKENRSPRVAVVKLGSIGDCIHMLPVMRALRRNIPKAYIVWVVEEKAKEVLLDQDGIDDLVVIDTKLWRRLLKSGRGIAVYNMVNALRKRLSDYRFDFAIDGQGLLKSGFITLMTKAPCRIGFSRKACREGINTLFTTCRVVPSGLHVIEQNLSLLGGMGITDRSVSFNFTLPPSAIARIVQWRREVGFDSRMPLVALHLGAGFETKQWPEESFLRLAEMLLEKEGIPVVITSGEGHSKKVESFVQRKSKRLILAPLFRLQELAALYQSCRVVVAGDTGPLHLAVSVGCQTVSLFGPSEAGRSGPYGKGHCVHQQQCICRGSSPYFPRRCRQSRSCIEKIGIEEVFDSVKMLVKEGVCQ
ncbi:MAG: glycosyltransferase family 9 protein [Nitrospira sp.]|nr:glycosyltransferase family 9 protein [Candidatus Manganitrophaceae bacterium]HIL35536.1 glycosyltransferase family 9 protein [Candidatus Manganitrophaceae bacterium]